MLATRMDPLFENILWHTLTGPLARFSTGTDRARRFAPGFPEILAFADPVQPDLTALIPFCQPGEHYYCAGWAGPAPAGWKIEEESPLYRMIWDSPPPAVGQNPALIPLGPQHAVQALELARLTRPGPFGIRTLELGDYFGVFDGDRLVAMAGERMHAGKYREISAVCTHPDFQGRGLARQLMTHLILRQLQRHEVPFLHVMGANVRAHEFYARLGFRDCLYSSVRVLTLA